jgi:PIN domain nuclease of toxin-antitoxin system
MKVLVDTHAFFWWVENDPKLSRRARTAIEDNDNEVVVSAVVAWELATKARFGKWPEAVQLASDIDTILERNDMTPLPISLEHARIAGWLSMHHRDPFDRILAAQSQIEGIPLVTADPVFRTFGTRVLW